MQRQTFLSTARPRLKPIYPRYREQGTLFRVGAQRDFTTEFDDPTGQVWFLLSLLDGTRRVAEVIDTMIAQYPALSPEDVMEGLDRLDAARLLDDAAPCRFDGETPYARYAGNVNYFSHFQSSRDSRGDHQTALCDSTVTLLGLGGGGSTILQLLGAVGVGHIRAVDHDRVELGNLNRQLLYTESDIGSLKADAAERMAKARNSLQSLHFRAERIDSPNMLVDIIAGSDVVISAVDEPPGEILRIVNKACVGLNVPCIFGGSQISRGRVFSIAPYRSGCIDCMFMHYDEIDDRWASRFREFRALDFRAPTVAFAPNIMRLCAEIADEAIRMLTGYLPLRSLATQFEVDFETGKVGPVLDWERHDDCPTCGHGSEEAFARYLGTPVLSLASNSSKGSAEHQGARPEHTG